MPLPEPLPVTVMVVGGDCEILLSWRHPDVIPIWRDIKPGLLHSAGVIFTTEPAETEYGICCDPKEALSHIGRGWSLHRLSSLANVRDNINCW